MTTPLTLTPTRRPDGVTVLTAVGEIDMTNSECLATAISAAEGRLVVDLTGVDYLDSAGLNVLFAHSDRLELIASPLLEPVLTISGLAGLTRMHGPGNTS